MMKAAWDRVPSPVQDVIASTVDRVQGNTIPAAPVLTTDKPIRLFVGPANWAGQGKAWGRAAEENPLVISRNMISAEINGFGYEVDYAVRWRTMTHSREWQKSMLAALIENYTHVLIEAEMPILGGMYGGDVRRQVAAMRAGGLVVGMVCHGTDIRLPSRHRALEPWSPFINDDWIPVHRAEKLVLDNRTLLDDVAAPTFVSTAGLLIDVPYARYLPVVIDAARWRNEEPLLERARPRVVHVPSNPLPKGTLHIESTMMRLHDEGVIEYIEISGRTQSEMPGLFASADIVLDQFRVGDYGVGACESMASGRLVVSHVSDQVRSVLRTESGMDLPIVEATIDSLEAVLRDVVSNRAHYRAIATEGPRFVSAVHDGRLARAVLDKYLLVG